MAKPTVVVTPRSMTSPEHSSLERIREAGYEVVCPSPGTQPNEEQLLNALSGAVGYVAGVEPVSRRVLEAAKALRVISRNGVGTDNVDMKAAGERGIEVLRATGMNARGVAELTLAHMLTACRRIDTHASALRAHRWERSKGIELQSRTVGVVGCGAIGKMVAELCTAFGMNVLGYDLYPDSSFDPGGSFRFVELDELLSRADVVTLHAPVPEDGKPLLDAQAFARMGSGKILVNTARFELLEPVATAEALDRGILACLTLDAFRSEPPDDWSLIVHPSVIATPHIGGFTSESVDRVCDLAVENVLNALRAGS